jgi:VWFA-related protein
LSGAVLLVLLGAAVPQDPPVFRGGVEAVYVDVFVTRGGRPVDGLGPADFEVLDNGIRQEVERVEIGEEPLSALLVLDTSQSVAGRTLDELRLAGHAFLDGLAARDRAALISFSHAVAASAALTSDLRIVRRALDDLRAGGGTALLDALYMALQVARPLPRPALLVFTDGGDTTSWLGEQAVAELAETSSAVVYAIGSASPFLERVAEASGGRTWPRAESGLKAAFVDVLRDLKTRYVLRFTPRSAGTAGWHELKVRLTRVNARARARRGYFRSMSR